MFKPHKRPDILLALIIIFGFSVLASSFGHSNKKLAISLEQAESSNVTVKLH